MVQASTLNIRLVDSLKTHGNQVLAREGISVSEAVRKLYEYLEREQKMPECLMENSQNDIYEQRRSVLKRFAGCAPLPQGFTADDVRRERLARKGLEV